MRAAVRAYAQLLDGAHRLLALSVVLSVVQSLVLLPAALLVRRIFDTDLPHHDSTGVTWTGAAVLVLYVLSALVGLANRWVVVIATKDAMTRLRTRLWHRLYELPRGWYDAQEPGRVHGSVVQDTERLDLVISQSLSVFLPAVVVTAALGVLAAVLDPLLTLVLAGVLPLLTLLSRWLGAVVERYAQDWHRHFDRFSAEVTQGLRGMVMVTALGTAEAELARRTRTVEALSESGRRLAWRVSAWTIAQGTVAAGAGIAVLVVGGREVSAGSLTIGALLSFYAIAALLLRSVSTVVGALPALVTGGASLRRVQEVLDADAEPPYRGTRRIEFSGDVRLEGVSFGYDERPLIRDLDLVLRPGERVALVGPNGAGKSTVTALVLGLYRPQSGVVRADGVAYDELDLAHLRARFGVVLQELVLADGTVAEAIRHGREATMEQVRLAARRAGADAVVAGLADGYDARIGEEGSLLSGGQRQRIGLARALLGEPRLVVLDEPTTHLDDAAIAHLLTTLAELPWRPSVLVVTHDSAAAASADRVVVLRDGRTAAQEVPVP